MKAAHAAADVVASEAETCDGCERAYFGAGLYTNTGHGACVTQYCGNGDMKTVRRRCAEDSDRPTTSKLTSV